MNGKERRLYGTVFVLAVLLASLGGYVLSSFAFASNNNGGSTEQHTMVILGTGTVKAEPTSAKLRLGVVTQASTATETLQQNSEKMNQVIEALEALGLTEEELETSHFSIEPVYDYHCTPPSLIGYRVSNQITVTTTQLDLTGRIIDASVQAGANQVYGLDFTLTEQELIELKQQALIEAVEDAKDKAAIIADALGVEIVGVAYVTETIYNLYYPRWDTVYAKAESFETPIIPGEKQITATVHVTFIVA
ncbi:MAG: SIMPL domain-containing protein [Thermoproteota archaeon]|nr:SIMPL domain-containing protein [Thermoproteota archaeon]